MKYDSEAETRKHISNVAKYISKVIGALLDRAIFHDKSKLEEPEKTVFDKYTPKLKDTIYGSEKYKKYLSEMQIALKHHYKVNRHHPEHWHEAGVEGMSLVDLIEMLCDWKSATLRHKDGDIKKSIEYNQKRFGFSDELKKIFLNTVDDIFTP
jgi:hypothetical protein